MKKLIAILLVAGALSSGNKVYADGNNKKPARTPVKHLQVSFDNVYPGSKLYVKDGKGLILYTENINSDGNYSREFDFSTLPADDYYFEIDKEALSPFIPLLL